MSSFIFIAHQLMTINGMFIFFIIPIMAAFSHIFLLKYYKSRNYLLYLSILLSVISSMHYTNKYILTRDFADLSEVNLKNTIDAKILDEKLSGLKWITPLYPSEPKKEITRLNKV